MIEVHTVTAPAYWASALVNGDMSGLEADPPDTSGASLRDLAAYHRFAAELAEEGLRVVGVACDQDGESLDSRFTWMGTLYGSPYPGCDVLDYVAHRVLPAEEQRSQRD